MRLRVLHCIYDDPGNPWVGGGGAMRLLPIYTRLSDRVDVTIATGRYPGTRGGEIEGVRHLRLGRSGSYLASRLTYARAATRLLREATYDVAIVDHSLYAPVGLPPHRRIGAVVHMILGDSLRDRWGRAAGGVLMRRERRELARFRRICCTSLPAARTLRALPARPDVWYTPTGGVAEEFFRVRRREGRHLLYYGRFDVYQKGIDTLLTAFAELRRLHPTIELRIAGRGRDVRRVRARIASLGLGAAVEVRAGVGRDEVLRLMEGALALVCPSRFEGAALVPLEAMAAGVPVVGTDVGDVGELLREEAADSVVPPEAPDALVRALDRLLHDAPDREARSRSGRAAAARFGWSAVAESHWGFLRWLADGSAATPTARDASVEAR